jgi:hypothetical protein
MSLEAMRLIQLVPCQFQVLEFVIPGDSYEAADCQLLAFLQGVTGGGLIDIHLIVACWHRSRGTHNVWGSGSGSVVAGVPMQENSRSGERSYPKTYL